MLTVFLGILALGVIVFVHEMGHFIAARLSGVTVETFSVGMGPVLLRKKIGDTEYRLSLIPVGGYCGMKGEKAFQQALDEKLDAIPREPNSFYGVHPLKRIAIAFAGPFANLIFAFLAFIVIAFVGYTYQTTGNKIILADEFSSDMPSVASQAGLQSGDKIISINGKKVDYFTELSNEISTRPGETLLLEIERNNQIMEIFLKPHLDPDTGMGRIGVYSWVDLLVSAVKEDSKSYHSGLRPGDRITEVDSVEVRHTMDFQRALKNKTQVQLTINRNGKILTLPFAVTHDEKGNLNIDFSFFYYSLQHKATSFGDGIYQGIKETGNMFYLSIKSLFLLFKGVNVSKAVSGPVRITVMLGDATQEGFKAGFSIGIVTVCNFLALISISLFIMNLLPIPVLDGGLILFAVIELLRRKPVSPKVLYRVQFIGIGFIVILFAFALFGDLNFLFNR